MENPINQNGWTERPLWRNGNLHRIYQALHNKCDYEKSTRIRIWRWHVQTISRQTSISFVHVINSLWFVYLDMIEAAIESSSLHKSIVSQCNIYEVQTSLWPMSCSFKYGTCPLPLFVSWAGSSIAQGALQGFAGRCAKVILKENHFLNPVFVDVRFFWVQFHTKFHPMCDISSLICWPNRPIPIFSAWRMGFFSPGSHHLGASYLVIWSASSPSSGGYS